MPVQHIPVIASRLADRLRRGWPLRPPGVSHRITLSLLVTTLLFAAASLPVLAGNAGRAQAFIQRGLHALDVGEITKAEKNFLRARETDPDLPQPVALLGQIAMIRGNWDEAEAHFLRAIELQLGLRDRLARERILVEGGQVRDAMERGIDSRAAAGPSGQLQAEADAIRLGERLRRIERDRWEEDLDDGVPADFYLYLGNARVRAGRPEAAAAAFAEACRRAPDAPEPHHNLAVALHFSGRRDEALAECRAAAAMGYAPSQALCAEIEAGPAAP